MIYPPFYLIFAEIQWRPWTSHRLQQLQRLPGVAGTHETFRPSHNERVNLQLRAGWIRIMMFVWLFADIEPMPFSYLSLITTSTQINGQVIVERNQTSGDHLTEIQCWIFNNDYQADGWRQIAVMTLTLTSLFLSGWLNRRIESQQ